MDHILATAPRGGHPAITLLAMLCAVVLGGGPARAEGRVDLARPVFSDPTTIDNVLFPVSLVAQAVHLGQVEGQPARIEVTLLSRARTLTWEAQAIDSVPVQFLAVVDGRIAEIAIDHYAQAEDGSVWYLGEDVFNFEDGVVADHEGSWMVGVDGPGGMIMPARPAVGDVYRPENIPDLVLEEDTVRSVTETIDGPRGPISDALLVEEHLMDGSVEQKVYAPGYGEFQAQASDELTTIAVAVPTDASSAGPPDGLARAARAAQVVVAASFDPQLGGLEAAVAETRDAWASIDAEAEPPLLVGEASQALDRLAEAVADGSRADLRSTAIAVATALGDLQLRYRPLLAAELDRMAWLCRQVTADALADDGTGVLSAAAILRAVLDRMAGSLDATTLAALADGAAQVSFAAEADDLPAASAAADALRVTVEAIGAGS